MALQKIDWDVLSGKVPIREWGQPDWAWGEAEPRCDCIWALSRCYRKLAIVGVPQGCLSQGKGSWVFVSPHYQALTPVITRGNWSLPLWPRAKPSERHFLESWVLFLDSGYFPSSLLMADAKEFSPEFSSFISTRKDNNISVRKLAVMIAMIKWW